MLEALCRQSSTTLDIVHAEDGPPITQRTSGLEQGARRPLCGDRSRCDEAPLPPALIAVDLEPHLAKVTA